MLLVKFVHSSSELCIKKMSFCSVTGGNFLKGFHYPEECVGKITSIGFTAQKSAKRNEQR